MTKTMGQIAYEAGSTFLAREYLEDATPWENELPGVVGLWESGADAVLEQAARRLVAAAETADVVRCERAGIGGVSISPTTLEWRKAAEFIRSLKRTQEV